MGRQKHHVISAIPLLIQLPDNLPRKAEDGPSAWALAPIREAWEKLLATGLGLAQFGEWESRRKIFLPNFQIRKSLKS